MIILELHLDGSWTSISFFPPKLTVIRVIIFDPVANKEYFFLCGKWFDKSEGDGLIERDIPASDKDGVSYAPLVTYKLKVMTGDRKGAGTNANVFINIFGENGDSGEKKLEGTHEPLSLFSNSFLAPNSFERARTDLFEIECGDLGTIKRILIRVSLDTKTPYLPLNSMMALE